MVTSGTYIQDITVGSVYMHYDSDDLLPQEDVKKFVAYANNKGLEFLLGCYANSHHEVCGCTDINQREGLLDLTRTPNYTSPIQEETQPSWIQEDRKC
jgi:hypothetical protein